MLYRLTNPRYLVLKAILASFLALVFDEWLGNPDHVSSTFIAILCVSPTVLMGLKNAWEQLLGSCIGGVWGALFLSLNLSIYISLPISIGCSITCVFLLRIGNAYPIAAFTSLLMLLIPWGSPFETFGVRFLALGSAALSGFLVNAIISSMAYPSIFERRYKKSQALVISLFHPVLQGDVLAADEGFEMVVILQKQLSQTCQELAFRKAHKTRQRLGSLLTEVRNLNYLLHLIVELSLLLKEKQQLINADEFFKALNENSIREVRPYFEEIEFQRLEERIFVAMNKLR